MDRIKILIACGLGIIILFVVGMMLFAKDVVFKNEVVIEYPDGCIETYVNTKPTSPMCVEGRKIAEQQLTKGASANSNTLWTGDESWIIKKNESQMNTTNVLKK